VAEGVKPQPNAESPTKVGEAHSMEVEDEIINCIALSAKGNDEFSECLITS